MTLVARSFVRYLVDVADVSETARSSHVGGTDAARTGSEQPQT